MPNITTNHAITYTNQAYPKSVPDANFGQFLNFHRSPGPVSHRRSIYILKMLMVPTTGWMVAPRIFPSVNLALFAKRLDTPGLNGASLGLTKCWSILQGAGRHFSRVHNPHVHDFIFLSCVRRHNLIACKKKHANK